MPKIQWLSLWNDNCHLFCNLPIVRRLSACQWSSHLVVSLSQDLYLLLQGLQLVLHLSLSLFGLFNHSAGFLLADGQTFLLIWWRETKKWFSDQQASSHTQWSLAWNRLEMLFTATRGHNELTTHRHWTNIYSAGLHTEVNCNLKFDSIITLHSG